MTSSPVSQRIAARAGHAGLDVRAWTVIVFGAALLVRLAYLADIGANPFFRTPVIDAEFYHQQALSQASGEPQPRVPFQMPPLYSFVLSLVYRLTRGDLVAAHLLQMLLGAATAALVFVLARRVAAPALGAGRATAAALVAAGVVATSKALLFLEGDLLAAPLAVFLDLLGVWFLARWADAEPGSRPALRDLAASGLAFGLAALALPLVLVCVPVLSVWMAWRRRRAAAAVAWVALVVLCIVPVAVRNRVVGGEWVAISANGGINLWLGNNPNWRRTSALRPGPEWRVIQEMPFRAGVVASSDRDRWFQRQVWLYVSTEPGHALQGLATKALLLAHDHEIMRDVDLEFFATRFSRLLRVPGWSFSWLLALAIVGLVWAGRAAPPAGAAGARRPPRAPGSRRVLQLFLASYAAGIVLFFVTSRYRSPLVPVLAVFAGMGAVWAYGLVRARAWGALGPAAGAFALVVLVSEIDFFGVDRVDIVEGEYRVATTYEKRGQWVDALALYDANLRRDPNHALSAARAALCAERLGRLQEAVTRYETLLERHPDYAEAAVNLGHLAARGGDRDAAAHYYRMAVAADPYMAQAHAAYGQFLVQTGDATAAVASMRQALVYDPTWVTLRVEYAHALAKAGDVTAAEREIDAAAKLLPPSPRVELVRGDVLAARGDAAGARAAWQRGLQLAPGDSELARRLGGR